jgi:VIT1/CCC1 family predicted Fe2+/Mn2+ transporter
VGNLQSVIASLVLSGGVLFFIGAATSLFTGRAVLLSGIRQLSIGYTAAAITFGVGHLVGVAIG